MRCLTVSMRENLEANLVLCIESPIIYILDDTLLLHLAAHNVRVVGEKDIKTTPPLKIKYCDRH